MVVSDGLALKTTHLSRSFGDIQAVRELNLEVRKGEMFAIVGPDGAGKTTTIRMVCGILKPTQGTASVLGYDLISEPAGIKRRIGYLSQRFSLYGDLSVDENIEFFAELHGVHDYRDRRDELLAFTRLTPFRDRLAERLSGGMRQKLALACTLIHTPDLLLLDEPTTGVDPLSRRDFWVILRSLVLKGMTIVLTTPYLDEAERCSRIALMNQGGILKVGTMEELRAEMRGEVVELMCSPVRQASDTLRQSAEFIDVQTFGDRINLIVHESSSGMKRAEEILQQSGMTPTAKRSVRPTLENIFITLLSRQYAGKDPS